MPMYRKRTLPTRTLRGPSLLVTAITACGAAYAYHTEYVPVTAVLMGLAFVTFWDWCIYKVITYRQMLEKPYIPGDDVRMLEAIKAMDENQLTAAFAAMGYEYQAPPELEPPVADPEIAEGVTKSYAISKLDKAAKNDGYLEPIRSTSEGTPSRRQYALFMAWAEREGLITPASGPKPARVKDYSEARRRITG